MSNATFALTSSNAPPATVGLLALTGNRFANPVVVLGVDLWVDPSVWFVQLPASSNAIGASEVTLPLPNNPRLAGARLFAQFLWLGPNAPLPCPPFGFSASNALEFTVQP